MWTRVFSVLNMDPDCGLTDPRIRRKEDGLILPEANEAKATRWAWIKKGSLKFSHAVPVEV